ncbi:hypothetical protein [Ancylobacter sp. IITR112]|uniref:hypothetical protein n=1 Tax=Ancylobacter sp. IITR112 TaxID=3138073 RepID=UPI00352B2255
MLIRHRLTAIAVGIAVSCSALAQEGARENTARQTAAAQTLTEKSSAQLAEVFAGAPTLPANADYLYLGEGLAQWGMAATGLLALFVSVLAVVLLQKTLKSTRDAVLQAEKGSDAAIKSVEVTKRIGEAQVRAYVSAQYCILHDIAVGKKPWARVGFHNSGATPAQPVNVRGSIIFGDLPQSPDHSQFIVGRRENTAGLASGASASTEIRRLKPFTEEEYERFIDGTGAFYIYVAIKFDDVFGYNNTSRTIFIYRFTESALGATASVAEYGNSFQWGQPPINA